LKRSVLLVLLAFGLIAMASAHGPKRAEGPSAGSPGARNPNARVAVEQVTVSGDIVIVRGSPAVKNGDVIYVLNRNFSLFGLVDGLKEGARVTIEGRAIEGRAMGTPSDGKVMFLVPSKVTFNGKTYDNLEPPALRMGQGRNAPGRPGSGPQGNFRRPNPPGKRRR